MEKVFRELKEKTTPNRFMVVYELQKFGTGALDYLHLALTDEDKWVRYAAADSLGAMGEQRSIQHLISTLLEDEDQDVRFVSAEALGRIGHADAIGPLRQAHKDDNGYVKIAIEEALDNLAAAEIRTGTAGMIHA